MSGKYKIVIVTDSWSPIVSGVTTALEQTVKYLEEKGCEVKVIHPGMFKTIPLPTAPEVRMVVKPTYQPFEDTIPDCKNWSIHIATEFTVGLLAKKFYDKNGFKYTTSYCTDFPALLKKHLCVPRFFTYKYLRWFHKKSAGLMVSTKTVEEKLKKQGFSNLCWWGHGVDTELFKPIDKIKLNTRKPKPIALYVGRVSKEKTIEKFLQTKDDWNKVVVGDGPHRKYLEKKYEDVSFMGYAFGQQLVILYNLADVFVFPSSFDTFGLVMLEALACGIPVAAYPVQGPVDLINNHKIGYLSENLDYAISQALKYGDADACRTKALEYSWEKCTLNFMNNLVFA